MQAYYPECFEREMGCTEADWLRWLPQAVGEPSGNYKPAQRACVLVTAHWA
jgi:hypothetical protein